MATLTHPTGNGYCRDRILRDRTAGRCAATMSEAKFVSLRKRLDQLGYRQSLSVDSLPLVEKIFGDLLHTTDSLKAAKQELSRRNEQKVRQSA